MSSEQPARSVAEELAAEQLAVDTWRNRRTALVALRGEVDLLTASKVAEAAIQRVLELTGVEDILVLVDDPDDLVPPPFTR